MTRFGYAGSLFLTAALAVTLAFVLLKGRSAAETHLTAGYDHLWSAQGAASPDFRAALRRDPASPYRWSDLAEALWRENNTSGAQYCISQAVSLGPHVPAILLRAGNLHWLLGQPDLALTFWRQILAETGQYDSILFHSYERMGLTMQQVLDRGLPPGSRAARSYFGHVLSTSRPDQWQTAWLWLSRHGWVDQDLALDYTGYLFSRQLYHNAADTWTAYAHGIPNGYSPSNLIFNGDFERELSGSVLDWQITPVSHVEARPSTDVAYSGSKSLQIRFNGAVPADYQGISQAIVPPQAGEYRFEAQVRTQALACEEGLRFRIFDAEAPARLAILTDQVTGTSGWTPIRYSLRIPPQTRVLQLQAILRPSVCTAERVFGTAWIDGVKLIPQSAQKLIQQPPPPPGQQP